MQALSSTLKPLKHSRDDIEMIEMGKGDSDGSELRLFCERRLLEK